MKKKPNVIGNEDLWDLILAQLALRLEDDDNMKPKLPPGLVSRKNSTDPNPYDPQQKYYGESDPPKSFRQPKRGEWPLVESQPFYRPKNLEY